jgi:N-acetylneuraminic acid mutarotase
MPPSAPIRPFLSLGLLLIGMMASLASPAGAQTAGTWATTGSMTTQRLFATAAVLQNGQVLVVGGDVASAELYTPATGAWTLTGSMSTDREQHTATLLPNGQVLVAGGGGGSSPALSSAELYNPGTGTWTVTGSMHDARTDASAALLQDG